MFTRIAKAAMTGSKFAFIALAVGSILAFAGAPTLFGMVIITASVIMTVYLYTLIGFAAGFIYKYFFQKEEFKPEVSSNGEQTSTAV